MHNLLSVYGCIYMQSNRECRKKYIPCRNMYYVGGNCKLVLHFSGKNWSLRRCSTLLWYSRGVLMWIHAVPIHRILWYTKFLPQLCFLFLQVCGFLAHCNDMQKYGLAIYLLCSKSVSTDLNQMQAHFGDTICRQTMKKQHNISKSHIAKRSEMVLMEALFIAKPWLVVSTSPHETNTDQLLVSHIVNKVPWVVSLQACMW